MEHTGNDKAHELARIGKIIARLDSPNEAEAVAALHMARARLAALGMSLADWQRHQLASAGIPALQLQTPSAPQTPATDWQRIAAETADRLWQLGQELYALGIDKQLDQEFGQMFSQPVSQPNRRSVS